MTSWRPQMILNRIWHAFFWVASFLHLNICSIFFRKNVLKIGIHVHIFEVFLQYTVFKRIITKICNGWDFKKRCFQIDAMKQKKAQKGQSQHPSFKFQICIEGEPFVFWIALVFKRKVSLPKRNIVTTSVHHHLRSNFGWIIESEPKFDCLNTLAQAGVMRYLTEICFLSFRSVHNSRKFLDFDQRGRSGLGLNLEALPLQSHALLTLPLQLENHYSFI